MSKQTEHWIYTATDRVSNYLVSLAFLMPVFFGFMAYRYYEIFMMFNQSLQQLDFLTKTKLASGLIAGVGIFTTLIFMVHSSKLAPIPFKNDDQSVWHWDWSKLVLVFFAFTINAFFWKPWEAVSTDDLLWRWFCCIMFSSMDYGFVHLFKELRKERGLQQDITKMNERLSRLKQEVSNKEHTLTILEEEASSIEQLIADHTCPYCKEIQPSPGSLRTHKGHCKSKPNRS